MKPDLIDWVATVFMVCCSLAILLMAGAVFAIAYAMVVS